MSSMRAMRGSLFRNSKFQLYDLNFFPFVCNFAWNWTYFCIIKVIIEPVGTIWHLSHPSRCIMKGASHKSPAQWAVPYKFFEPFFPSYFPHWVMDECRERAEGNKAQSVGVEAVVLVWSTSWDSTPLFPAAGVTSQRGKRKAREQLLKPSLPLAQLGKQHWLKQRGRKQSNIRGPESDKYR